MIPTSLSNALAGTYRLERELGQGGMAVVYLATDLKHDRQVALKVMRPELKGMLGPRFTREIRTAARLQHPHICSVYDSGETPEGELWYTMPFIEGESLRDRMNREPKMAVHDAVRITREAAQGLEYAHKHGVIHRDIKPENILLTEDGNTLVADFGIARAMDVGGPGGPPSADGPPSAVPAVGTALTEVGTTVGTPAYMSPEQRLGDNVTAASDVYSLAAVLYEALAAEPVATQTSMGDLLALMRTTGPQVRLKRPDVSQNLETAIRQAAHPDPAQRTLTMAAFSTALEGAVSGQVPAVTMPMKTETVKRGKMPLLIGTAAVALIAVAAFWFAGRKPAEKRIAVMPFSPAPTDQQMGYVAGSMGMDLRQMLDELPGTSTATEAETKEAAGGRLTVADVAKQLYADIVIQPSGQRRDSTYELRFAVTDASSGKSGQFSINATPQWIVDHRDSLILGIMGAVGRAPSQEAASAATRWGLGTTNGAAWVKANWLYTHPRALLMGNKAEYAEFREAVDTVLALDPRFIDLLSGKVWNASMSLRFFRGEMTNAEAEELLASARRTVATLQEIDPNDARTQRALGYFLLATNDSAKAREAFGRSVQSWPSSRHLGDLCSLELKLVRASAPLPRSCDRLVASDSFNASALWRAGQLLTENDRFEAAVSALWRATKRKPTEAIYLTALAEALVSLGRNEDALREMTKAVALDPNDYSAHGVLAKVQQNLERSEAAIESWQTALRLSPQDPVLRRALVTTLIYTGRAEEAKAVAQEGIKLLPSSPRMYDALGLAYWGAGQFDSALVLFRRGTEMTSNVAWRWWNYSHGARLLGQLAEAERAIGRIRDLGGSARWRRRASCSGWASTTRRLRSIAGRRAPTV